MASLKTDPAPADLPVLARAPGGQYIVINENETIFEQNFGYAGLPSKTPVTPQTTFNNFSVTKTATATAIMQLTEQKKIRLADFANPLLEEFQFKYPFTIGQLVSHQAGFPDPIPISWIHLAGDEEDFKEHDFIGTTINKHSRQKFVPGSRFSYSSLGYLLLSLIIERVSGEPYCSYVGRNVLSKLGGDGTLDFKIRNARVHATGYHPRFSLSNLVLGLFLDRKRFVAYNYKSWLAFRNFYVNGKAYGGFIGNARGLASYLQCFLSNRLFADPQTQALMFTEQKPGMAYGWFTGALKGRKYLCHAGGGGGYYCEIRIYPDIKIASVFVRNSSSFNDKRLLDKIDPMFIPSLSG